jgi:hypothetical protein
MLSLTKLAEWTANTSFGKKALSEPENPSMFNRRPSFRLITGLFLLVVSYIIGWPFVGVAGFLAAYYREPLIALIGGPVTYGLSWLVFCLSMYLIGVEGYKGLNILLGHLARRFIQAHANNFKENTKISCQKCYSDSKSSNDRE